ncbi:hypothetical protein A7U60_g7643 [Sanghuangporus baumii]|uniref:Uncharacterized protein n=1 Tax=Sanghuangporus baumii TaxID=108892 RepID=A0A9Q5MZW1_SANBA|nr:hypothetical protein A7U60_g7643 [Sanghuangporus baumii]
MGYRYSSRTSAPKAPGIILGFDVGSITSAVSFALLLHDRPVEVRSVTWSTGQDSPANRIPSIMYYDRHGDLLAAGASTVSDSVICDAEDEGWFKVERFKIHLRPYDWKFDCSDFQPGLLPPSKTAIQVMGDFLRYLYGETVRYIKQHYSDGKEIWGQVSHEKYFVFSLPNGWDNVSQHRMLQAAIHAGLVSDYYEPESQVKFVFEGDASAFSCLLGHDIDDNPQNNRFVLFDAGESILQVASYEIDEIRPLSLKEISPSNHSYSGSVFIYARLRDLLKRKLCGSRYDVQEILDGILEDGFGSLLKFSFSDSKQFYLLRVGDRRDNDSQLDIQRGFLKLDRLELATCFGQCVRNALALIRQQVDLCGGKSMPVYLVGALSSNSWMVERLKESLLGDGITVASRDIDLNSAVADGCVSHVLHQAECKREAKRADGIICSR